MAVTQLIDRPIGYYEPGRETEHDVPLYVEEQLRTGPEDYFLRFKHLVGVDLNFVGEAEAEDPRAYAPQVVRYNLRASGLGAVFSTLVEMPAGEYSLIANHAFDLIDEPGMPLRAEKHIYRKVGRQFKDLQEGSPHTVSDREYRFIQNIFTATFH